MCTWIEHPIKMALCTLVPKMYARHCNATEISLRVTTAETKEPLPHFGGKMLFSRKARGSATLLCLCALAASAHADATAASNPESAQAAAAAAAGDLGPGIRNVPGPKVNDNPEDAWAEWGETEMTRKNPMPRRQRGIEEGMSVHTIIGQAMRQEKVLFAYLLEEAAPTAAMGKMHNSRFYNLMTAGGVACKTWYVHENGKLKRQIVLKCETIRDAHMGKDFMLKMPEVEKVNLDNLDFKPSKGDDDDDDDDEDEVSGVAKTGAGNEEKEQEKVEL